MRFFAITTALFAAAAMAAPAKQHPGPDMTLDHDKQFISGEHSLHSPGSPPTGPNMRASMHDHQVHAQRSELLDARKLSFGKVLKEGESLLGEFIKREPEPKGQGQHPDGPFSFNSKPARLQRDLDDRKVRTGILREAPIALNDVLGDSSSSSTSSSNTAAEPRDLDARFSFKKILHGGEHILGEILRR